MTVYEAIKKMRQLTAERKPFAMSYMSYSRQRRESHGEIEVEHALLIKNPAEPEGRWQDIMLTYQDQDTGDVRHLWQPLLMSLNHIPLTSIS